MPDSSDQIICKLQQENKKLKKTLKQKDEELNRERQMWNNRETGWDPSTSTDLHRIEVFDGVISDESSLHSATLCSREEFRYIFWTGRSVRDRLRLHAAVSRRRIQDAWSLEPVQAALQARPAHVAHTQKRQPHAGHAAGNLRGRPEPGVCRYLKVMDWILASVLPTAKNVSKEMSACKTKGEFKRMMPGPGGGDVTADGTHCPVQRPSEKTVRRMIHSGKKKRLTYNTNAYTNADGTVIGISRSSVGPTGDITLLREDPMLFGRWTESMRDGSTPEEDRIRIWVDRGYQGTGKDLPGATLVIPHKRSKNHRILTAEQKEHNHLVNSTRMRVEHSIGRLKRYARLTDPYDGTHKPVQP